VTMLQDDLPKYANIYRVTAQLTYLDAPEIPAETVTLFDPDENQSFTAHWTPKVAGRIAMDVTAQSIDGLTATAQRVFTVRTAYDLAVLYGGMMWVYVDSPIFSHPYVTVQNNGAEITKDVVVAFNYYRANQQTKLPEAYLFTHRQRIPAEIWLPFQRGETRVVEDQDFKPAENGLYYVEIVVDSPTTSAQT
jgi:hypothetical protein